jgi:hypothetical protein
VDDEDFVQALKADRRSIAASFFSAEHGDEETVGAVTARSQEKRRLAAVG